MIIVQICDHAGGCRVFGPFRNSLAARDWGLESQALGFFPEAVFTVLEIEEPYDLGYDPGL